MTLPYMWLSGVVVRMSDLRLAVVGLNPGHGTGGYFSEVSCCLNDVTTQVNSALHLFGVAKSSTYFGWGKGQKVTSARWQVTLCDPIWYVISHSGSRTAYTLLYLYLYMLLTNLYMIPIEDQTYTHFTYNQISQIPTSLLQALTLLLMNEVRLSLVSSTRHLSTTNCFMLTCLVIKVSSVNTNTIHHKSE